MVYLKVKVKVKVKVRLVEHNGQCLFKGQGSYLDEEVCDLRKAAAAGEGESRLLRFLGLSVDVSA